ncbi:hypothetical protein D9M68_825230 [compost metagenome]
MAGIHGLQHVQRFPAPTFADDDAVRAHAQAVLDQVADRHRALAFHIGRPRLQRHQVGLRQLQLGRILDRDDAFVIRDEAGQHVQQRGLA